MRRAVASVIILFYMMSSTEFHQALKLPLLVEHFLEHSSRAEMTFVQFLVMHYETDVAHDDTDMKLPFKDCQHSSLSQTAVVHPKLMLMEPLAEFRSQISTFYSEFATSSVTIDFFQPPRA